MAVTKTTVTGPVYLPNCKKPEESRIVFELTSWDREENEAVFVTGPYVGNLDESGEFEVELFTTTSGENNAIYRISVIYLNYDGTMRREYLGSAALAGPGPFKLCDLAIVDELDTVGSFDLLADVTASHDQINLWREEVNTTKTLVGVDRSYVESIVSHGVNLSYENPAEFLADTDLGYSGTSLIALAGAQVNIGEYRYTIMDATDVELDDLNPEGYHIENQNGVKLKHQLSSNATPISFGAVGDGWVYGAGIIDHTTVTDDTIPMKKWLLWLTGRALNTPVTVSGSFGVTEPLVAVGITKNKVMGHLYIQAIAELGDGTTLLKFEDCDYMNWECELTLIGGFGGNGQGSQINFEDRFCDIGFDIENSRHIGLLMSRCYGFRYRSGIIFNDPAVSPEINSFPEFQNHEAVDCGSLGRYDTTVQNFTVTSHTNFGSSGNANQYSELVVSQDIPFWAAMSGELIEVNGALEAIVSVNTSTKTFTLSRWANDADLTGEDLMVFSGGAIMMEGNNANVNSCGRCRATRCADGGVISGAYSNKADRFYSQYNASGPRIGREEVDNLNGLFMTSLGIEASTKHGTVIMSRTIGGAFIQGYPTPEFVDLFNPRDDDFEIRQVYGPTASGIVTLNENGFSVPQHIMNVYMSGNEANNVVSNGPDDVSKIVLDDRYAEFTVRPNWEHFRMHGHKTFNVIRSMEGKETNWEGLKAYLDPEDVKPRVRYTMLASKFNKSNLGNIVGQSSGATASIDSVVERDPKNGVMILSNVTGTFTAGETLISSVGTHAVCRATSNDGWTIGVAGGVQGTDPIVYAENPLTEVVGIMTFNVDASGKIVLYTRTLVE